MLFVTWWEPLPVWAKARMGAAEAKLRPNGGSSLRCVVVGIKPCPSLRCVLVGNL